MSARVLLLLACLSAGFTRAVAAAPTRRGGPVYILDLRPLNRLDLGVATNASTLWDTLHTVAVLQGLANRHQPQLYLFYCSDFGVETDELWFNWLRDEDGWLKESTVHHLGSVEEAVRRFRKQLRGLAIYDGNVPATSNLASTAAGCEDLLPVRFDLTPGSLYDLLFTQMGIEAHHSPALLDLTSRVDREFP